MICTSGSDRPVCLMEARVLFVELELVIRLAKVLEGA